MPLPADIATTLFVSARDPDILQPRFYLGESVRWIAQFRDAASGDLVDVSGVSFVFVPRDGVGDPLLPTAVQRLSVGVWACATRPLLAGRYQAIVRCLSPTESVAVRSFAMDGLPAGTPPPSPPPPPPEGTAPVLVAGASLTIGGAILTITA